MPEGLRSANRASDGIETDRHGQLDAALQVLGVGFPNDIRSVIGQSFCR